MSDIKTIAFFSSDAYPLYKIDIFRSLALPSGCVLQFRYKKEYIHKDINNEISNFTGKDGCIFFVPNNNLELSPGERDLSGKHSIRKVKIADVSYDHLTEQVLFFLELGDFHHYQVSSKDKELLPENNIFVSEINVIEGSNHSWINRIDEVKEFFPNKLFFNINKIKNEVESIVPKYSKQTNSSYFELKEQTIYGVEFSFYDLDHGNSILREEFGSNALTQLIPSGFSVKAATDSKIFSLQTLPLHTEKTLVPLKLGEQTLINDYGLELEFLIIPN